MPDNTRFNKHLTLDEVTELHKKGQLAEAKVGYLQLLQSQPKNSATIHHQLALLFAEEGDLDQAQLHVEHALEIAPNEPRFALHYTNILQAKGLFGQARDVLKQLVAKYPDYAPAYNNLGSVYYRQAKLNEAVDAFEAAIDHAPHYADAYYNLGLALSKLGERKKASQVYQALLELNPKHAGARFQLGVLLMERAQYGAAIEEFTAIEREHPFHLETETNIATSHLKLGQLNAAKLHYLKALALAPHDIQLLFNLAVISQQQGFLPEAKEYYLRVLNQEANHIDALNNLAIVYLALQNKAEALKCFRAILSIKPNDKALQHIVHTLEQAKGISATPPEYIQSLFNAYADHYDAHLIDALQYRVPETLYQLIKVVYLQIHDKELPDRLLNVLDLGCGTGLSGQLFRPHAQTLTGVDLAEQMLAIAQQKALYDNLFKADIVNFLKESPAMTYDIIFAADVLVYFGDLAPLFAAVAMALKPMGLFAFNIEVGGEVRGEVRGEVEVSESAYQLTVSGRFAHHKQYIEKIAAENQLEILQATHAFMRKQRDEDVYGMYYILGRA